MDNINQFNNNYFKINTISTKPAGIVNNSPGEQNQNQGQVFSSLNQNTQVINQQPILYNSQNLKMDSQSVLRYLQSLLEMPETIEKFLEELKNNNGVLSDSSGQKVQVIIKNMVDVAALALLLNENSKKAVDKLLNIISNTLKSGMSETSQMREILSVLVGISQNIGVNQNFNSVKELLLLYVPLNMQAFERVDNASELIEEETSETSDSQFSILFETLNFSNFICKINEIDNVCYINLNSDSDFLKEEFLRVARILLYEMNIKFEIDFESKREIVENKNNNIQNFKIISNGKVSINTLLIAHLIIKTIFKIDSDLNSVI